MSGIACFTAPALLALVSVAWAGEGVELGDERTIAEGPGIVRPRAIYAGGAYFIVWQDEVPGARGGPDIFAMRLDAKTLAPLDPEPLRVSAAPEAQAAPSVAYGRDRLLVVWQDFRNGKDWDVLGILIDARTGKAAGAELEVCVGGGNQARPVCAATEDAFLIAWQGIRESGQYGIQAKRFDAQGASLDSAAIELTAEGCRPAVCGAKSRFLVSWQTHGGGKAEGTARSLLDAKTGKAEQERILLPRCPDEAAVACDDAGNFMVVAARESFPNPWGWPGPGAILCSRVQADGGSPDAGHALGYRLSNICARSIPNVVDAATWGKSKTWEAGAPGGFRGTADGWWPRGWPAVAHAGRGVFLFAWVKGRLASDNLHLNRYEVWLRGMARTDLKVSPSDLCAAGQEGIDYTMPVLCGGGEGQALLAYLVLEPGKPRRLAVRKVSLSF